MPQYINGPVNYVQLSGNVNNIKKDITIFMDTYFDLNNQTRCDYFDSIDISQYLYNMIKNAKNKLDFFMEIRNEHILQSKTNKRDIYIKEVMEMFKSEFVIKKDKVRYSKSNTNVRLHYLDIRDHLELFYLTTLIHYEILPKLDSLKNNLSNQDEKNNSIEFIMKNTELIKQYAEKIFKNKNIIQQHKPQKFNKKTQKYYLNKIIHEYNNNELKTKINEFIDVQILKYFSDFQGLILQINQNLTFYKNKLNNTEHVDRLLFLFNSLDKLIVNIYTIFTDVYFLRRFLDKDYINNTITYCGRFHAINYMYFLIKYFDFKIFKIYNSNNLTIDTVMNKIKNTYDIYEIYNLFLIKGETPIQCINYLSMEDILLI